MAVTPANVLATIRNQVYEPSAGFYTDDEIYSYMWQAEYMLAKQTRSTETTDTSISTVASTREYSIPAGVMDISRVTWNAFPLSKIDKNDLDVVEGASYAFAGQSGQPIYYYEYGDYIGLSPIPDAAQTLKLWYVAEPTQITATSTAFTIPSDLTFYIADYCLYRMYLKDNETQKADAHMNIWLKNISYATNEWSKRNSINRRVIVRDSAELPDARLRIA